MSKSDVEDFIKSLINDQSMWKELDNRLEASGDSEMTEEALREEIAEVVPSFAAEQGYEFTAEEGFTVLDEIQQDTESGSLSDVELEQVAGGSKTNKVMGSVFTAGVACGIASAIKANDANENQSCGDYLADREGKIYEHE